MKTPWNASFRVITGIRSGPSCVVTGSDEHQRAESPPRPGRRHPRAGPPRAASLGPAFNAVYDAWSDAHEEAEEAYIAWRTGGGPDEYIVYRAAQDREDAAQDALAFTR